MRNGLIVNADDFGLCSGVNRAVVEAHQAGAVNSASLMVNMPGLEEAVGLARSHPNLDLGLHVALAAGPPASDPGQVPTLVDSQGRFLRRKTLLLKLLTGRIKSDEVHREVGAQVERYRAQGLRLAHINGDQHVHIFPVVRDAVLQAAKELGVAVRVPSERVLFRGWGSALPTVRQLPTLAAKVGLRNLARTFRARSRAMGVPTNDHFMSAMGILPRRPPTTADFVLLLDRLDAGVTELMVHPAHGDEEVVRLWGSRRLAEEREVELAALVDGKFTEAMGRSAIAPMTYWELITPA